MSAMLRLTASKLYGRILPCFSCLYDMVFYRYLEGSCWVLLLDFPWLLNVLT